MRTTTERPRGVTLTLIDLVPLLSAVPVGDDEQASIGWIPWAMFERDGTLYAVNHEGVGYKVTEAEPLPVDVFVSRPGFMAIAPRYLMSLSPDEVRAQATGDQIDLADLVRRFGARLEDNFRLWYREFTA